MLRFCYRGRDLRGKQVFGQAEGSTEWEAVLKTRRQNILVTDIWEVSPFLSRPKAPWLVNIMSGNMGRGGRVKLSELASFCRQLSTLVNAGIPIAGSLDITREQAESKELKRVLVQVGKSLEQGNALAVSLASHPGVFPEIFIFMVEAGELGGVLDQVLQRLAEHLEREHEIKERVKAALTYPAMVLSFSLLALVIMLTFILPKIIDVLLAMAVPLPLPTRIVMSVSEFMSQRFYLLPLLLLPVILFKLCKTRYKTRFLLDSLALKLPVFSKIYRKIIVARFCRTLGILLKGGVPITQALEVCKKSAGNLVLAAVVARAQDSVGSGSQLSEPIASCSLFPPLASRMIAVGEQTGALDTLLERVGQHFEKEVGISVSKLSSLIEPLLIIFLGAIVGFIVLAVMLPMMGSVVGGFN